MADNSVNEKVIEEFRANNGQVGGSFEGAPMILVHHKGRKTGTDRVNPLVYQPLEGRWAIFASKAGAPVDPEWYLNLMANPRTTIEVGSETHEVEARTAVGEERDRIWENQKKVAPGFAEYEKQAAGRVIPVVVLEPVS